MPPTSRSRSITTTSPPSSLANCAPAVRPAGPPPTIATARGSESLPLLTLHAVLHQALDLGAAEESLAATHHCTGTPTESVQVTRWHGGAHRVADLTPSD